MLDLDSLAWVVDALPNYDMVFFYVHVIYVLLSSLSCLFKEPFDIGVCLQTNVCHVLSFSRGNLVMLSVLLVEVP